MCIATIIVMQNIKMQQLRTLYNDELNFKNSSKQKNINFNTKFNQKIYYKNIIKKS